MNEKFRYFLKIILGNSSNDIIAIQCYISRLKTNLSFLLNARRGGALKGNGDESPMKIKFFGVTIIMINYFHTHLGDCIFISLLIRCNVLPNQTSRGFIRQF